jgi:hypothetical protein
MFDNVQNCEIEWNLLPFFNFWNTILYIPANLMYAENIKSELTK